MNINVEQVAKTLADNAVIDEFTVGKDSKYTEEEELYEEDVDGKILYRKEVQESYDTWYTYFLKTLSSCQTDEVPVISLRDVANSVQELMAKYGQGGNGLRLNTRYSFYDNAPEKGLCLTYRASIGTNTLNILTADGDTRESLLEAIESKLKEVQSKEAEIKIQESIKEIITE